MAETIKIGGELESMATGGVVAAASAIKDKVKNKYQGEINAEVDATLNTKVDKVEGKALSTNDYSDEEKNKVSSLEDAVGTGGSVDSRIATAKSEIIGDATTDYNTLGKVESKLASIEEIVDDCAYIGENDGSAVIADFDPQTDTVWKKAQTLSVTEKTQVQQNIGIREWLNNLTGEKFASYTATDQTTAVTQLLPATGATDTIYRVGMWDGSAYNQEYYSDYAWDGTVYVQLNKKSIVGEVFDISEYHAEQKYDDLEDALGTGGANVPVSVRKGGMSVRFVLNSDNKYMQFRCMAQSFTTDITQWQGIDDVLIAGSKNLIESCSVADYTAVLTLTEEGVGAFSKISNFIYSNGNIQPTSNWSVTPYIPVNNGDRFYFKTSGGNINTRPYIICDSSKDVLTIGTYNKETAYEGDIVINNVNAKYIVFAKNDSQEYILFKYNQFENKYEDIIQTSYRNVSKNSEDIKRLFQKTCGAKSNNPPCEIGYEQCELAYEGQYINDSGNLVSNTNWNVYKFVPNDNVIGFDIIGKSSFNGCFQLNDNSYEKIYDSDYYPSAPIVNLCPVGKKIKAIYFNLSNNNGTIAGVTGIKYYFADFSYLDNDGNEYLDCRNITNIHGYINDSGVFTYLRGYYVAKISYDENYDYFSQSLSVLGGIYDEDDNYLGKISDYIMPQGSPGKNLMPIGTSYFLVTCPRAFWRRSKKNPYSRIHTYLKKPFTFNGKSAVFFGDSITAGFVSVPGSSQYQDFNKSWAKLLSDKVGMSATNQAIGGSSLTYRSNETYNSGVKLIAGPEGTRYNITEDYIFIAHGTNDWAGEIRIGKVTDDPESYDDAITFYGALNLVAKTIKTLYPTKIVIFITPIYRADYGNFKYSLDDYRKAICDVAFRNNFNVVNGKEFGFECGSDLLIADKTHPTELGYQVYANQMYDRLV